MRKNKKSKRAQITVFVIIAIVIVAAIAVLAMFLTRQPGKIIPYENPGAYMEKCMKDSLEKTEKTILYGNGYINITDNYILYQGNGVPKEKVPYLCKSSEFYVPCINQEPMLIGHVKQEFQEQIKNESKICFNELLKSLKNKGYSVEEKGNNSIVIQFSKDSVSATMQKGITTKKEAETRNFESFSTRLLSPIYPLIDTARNIVNYESTLCEFNSVNWMRYYRYINIKKFITSDQSKIYTLTDNISGKRFTFAVKTCVLPAGI